MNWTRVSDNDISGSNHAGIHVNYSRGVVFKNNNCSINGIGIHLENCSSLPSNSSVNSTNVLCGNTLVNNVVGVNLTSSLDTVVYANNFLNNTLHAWDNGNNEWNLTSPTGGNYWDNWTTPDGNQDGFVDNPYMIPGGSNQDNLPLTNMTWNWSGGGSSPANHSIIYIRPNGTVEPMSAPLSRMAGRGVLRRGWMRERKVGR